MHVSTLTTKGQTTIPAEFRHALGLKIGDHLAFELVNDHLILKKITSFDKGWHKSLSQTLSEWESSEDEESYRDL